MANYNNNDAKDENLKTEIIDSLKGSGDFNNDLALVSNEFSMPSSASINSRIRILSNPTSI